LKPQDDLRHVGLGILLVGLLTLLAGCFIRMNTIQYLAFVIVLFGLVAFLYGRAITKSVAFPLLFAVAMLPMPMERVQTYTYKLKMFAAEGSVQVIDFLGSLRLHDFIVIRNGSEILWETASGTPEKITVGDPCSGLRSLIALIAFGALFAYVTKLSLTRKLILFAAAVPCALVSNMWRIVTLAFIACIWGSEATHGWVHDVTGYGIFAVAFILFFSLERLLQGFGPPDESEGPSRAPAAA
jgi:exosortase